MTSIHAQFPQNTRDFLDACPEPPALAHPSHLSVPLMAIRIILEWTEFLGSVGQSGCYSSSQGVMLLLSASFLLTEMPLPYISQVVLTQEVRLSRTLV